MSDSGNNDLTDDVFEWSTHHIDLLASDPSSAAGDPSSPGKTSHLPVARVKKIMKEGEHSGMIAADAPVLLAKACELLIKDLTLQSWDCTLNTRRCTLQRQDVTTAIFKNPMYSFLLDIFTPEELYPRMEYKSENGPQIQNMKSVNEGQNYSLTNDTNNPNEGCIRGSLTLGSPQFPVASNAAYQGGNNRYIMNQSMQGNKTNKRSTQMMQGQGLPTANSVLQYSNAMQQNVDAATLAILEQTGVKSHAVVQGATPYEDRAPQCSTQTIQDIKPQISYSQEIIAESVEEAVPIEYQP